MYRFVRFSLRSCGINYSDPYALEFPRYPCVKSQLALNRFLHRLMNFHLSLFTKFCSHFVCIFHVIRSSNWIISHPFQVTYVFFLLLFSYVLLFNFQRPTSDSPSIHWTEILTIILVSCMLVEEIQYVSPFDFQNLTLWSLLWALSFQISSQDSLRFFGKCWDYFRDLLKLIRFSAIVLFYIGMIVRFTNINTENDFVAARFVERRWLIVIPCPIDLESLWRSILNYGGLALCHFLSCSGLSARNS